MDSNYTHISMVIDRSGSMSSCWSDVKGGYAELVKQNKEAEGKCTFTVAAFDTEYDLLEDFTDIKDVKETLLVNPRGGTALLDAIGKTIVSVGEKLAKLDEQDRPMKVLMVIQTDGWENASREFKKDDVKKMIKDQTDVYKWEFQFIGASLESVEEAKSWGIKGSNASTVTLLENQEAWHTLGSKMKNMRAATTMDSYSMAATFTEDDKKVLNAQSATEKWSKVLEK